MFKLKSFIAKRGSLFNYQNVHYLKTVRIVCININGKLRFLCLCTQ